MVSKEVVSYIENARLSGASDDAIRKALIEAQYSWEDVEEGLKEAPRVYGYFDKLRDALFSPLKLFSSVKDESWRKSFKFVCASGVFVGLLYSIVSLVLIYLNFETGSKFLLVLFGPFILVFLPLIMATLVLVVFICLSFIAAGILHVLAKIVRGQGTYLDTYKVFAYSLAPSFIGGLLVFLPYEIGNIVVSVWSLIITIVGISTLHSISKLRATLALVIPVLVIAVVGFLVYQSNEIVKPVSVDLGGPVCAAENGQWCYKTETSELCVNDESDCWSALALKFGQPEFCERVSKEKKRDVCNQLVR